MSGGIPIRVVDHIYIGDRNSAKARGLLKQHKINYILNCTPDRDTDPVAGCPCFFEKDPSMTYQRVPIFDNRGEDVLIHMESSIAFITQAKYYGNVLVHCNQGRSRSASFILGYMMKKYEMSFPDAIAQARINRPEISPNEAFIEQLKTYDLRLAAERELEAQDCHSNKKEKTRRGQTENKGRSTRSIGPSRPPAVAEAIGPSIGPLRPPAAAAAIGPSIGPSRPPAAAEAIGPSIGPSRPPAAAAAIGNSPPKKRALVAEEAESGKEDANKKSKAGKT